MLWLRVGQKETVSPIWWHQQFWLGVWGYGYTKQALTVENNLCNFISPAIAISEISPTPIASQKIKPILIQYRKCILPDTQHCYVSEVYCIRPVTSHARASTPLNTFGTVAEYECDEGYEFEDNSTMKAFTCDTNGWVPPPQPCIGKLVFPWSYSITFFRSQPSLDWLQ